MRGLPRRDWLTLAAINGFSAIAMGAFAAHAVKDPKAAEWIQTGAQYAFWHTMATFASAALMGMGAPRARFAPAFFLTGSVIYEAVLEVFDLPELGVSTRGLRFAALMDP